jgi:hypothetical protein
LVNDPVPVWLSSIPEEETVVYCHGALTGDQGVLVKLQRRDCYARELYKAYELHMLVAKTKHYSERDLLATAGLISQHRSPWLWIYHLCKAAPEYGVFVPFPHTVLASTYHDGGSWCHAQHGCRSLANLFEQCGAAWSRAIRKVFQSANVFSYKYKIDGEMIDFSALATETDGYRILYRFCDLLVRRQRGLPVMKTKETLAEYDTRMLHHFFDRLVQGNLYHDRAWVTLYVEGLRPEITQALSNTVQLKLDKCPYSRPLPNRWQPDQLLPTIQRLLPSDDLLHVRSLEAAPPMNATMHPAFAAPLSDDTDPAADDPVPPDDSLSDSDVQWSIQALMNTESQAARPCYYCSKTDHVLSSCPTFLALGLPALRAVVRESRRRMSSRSGPPGHAQQRPDFH